MGNAVTLCSALRISGQSSLSPVKYLRTYLTWHLEIIWKILVFSSDVSLLFDWAWDTSGLNYLPGLFYFDKSKGQYAPSFPFLHGQYSLCHHSTADMFDIRMWKSAGEPNLKCSFLKYELYWIFRMLEIQTGFCFAAIPSSSVQWTKAKSSPSVNFPLRNLIEVLELLLVFSLVYEIWRKQVVLDKNWERCTCWFQVQLISSFV